MRSFNLSALAVRERAITLFFIFASACAGIYAYFHLGRAEDPSLRSKCSR
jgi:multidrug efflux pump subunit AcrB